MLTTAATGIGREAADHGVISEARVPVIHDEVDIKEDGDEPAATREYIRKQGTKIIELTQRHAFGKFGSERADNRICEDKQVLDLFFSACLTQ